MAALAAAVVLAAVVGTAAVIAVQTVANRALTTKNDELSRRSGREKARFEPGPRGDPGSFKSGVEEDETLKNDSLKPLRDKLLGSARQFYDRLGDLLEGQADAASRRCWPSRTGSWAS